MSSGSSSGQRLLCILGVRLHMSSWLLLGSGFGVLSSISPLSSMVFSIELTVQCDGCLMWGVGQAYGVFQSPDS